MLNKERHQLIMGQILKDIYTNTRIAPLVGFKGGTCAYFFYGLPRFSVDLDFDLLVPGEENIKKVFQEIQAIIGRYGAIKDECVKLNTILFEMSYGPEDRNIKIEISVREWPFDIREQYAYKEYLGIPMLAAKKDYLFAGKLAALLGRGKLATRDIYDIYFFAKNNWDINEKTTAVLTGKKLNKYLSECVKYIEKIPPKQILRGLGELISDKEKAWAKTDLKQETVFLLKLRKKI